MARVAGAPMCVITLTYVVAEDEVDRFLKSHVTWLEQGFEEGVLVLAGRMVPRTGGIIICRGRKAEVEAYAATDPFVTGGVATASVGEVAVSFASEGLAAELK